MGSVVWICCLLRSGANSLSSKMKLQGIGLVSKSLRKECSRERRTQGEAGRGSPGRSLVAAWRGALIFVFVRINLTHLPLSAALPGEATRRWRTSRAEASRGGDKGGRSEPPA